MADEPEKPLVKPMNLQLNREQAELLLEALRGLPEPKRRVIIYDALYRDVESIRMMWDRIIKAQRLVSDQRKKMVSQKKQMSGQPYKASSPPQ